MERKSPYFWPFHHTRSEKICRVFVMRSFLLFSVYGLCSDVRIDIYTKRWYVSLYITKLTKMRGFRTQIIQKSLFLWCKYQSLVQISVQISYFGANITVNIRTEAMDREQRARTQNRETANITAHHMWLFEFLEMIQTSNCVEAFFSATLTSFSLQRVKLPEFFGQKKTALSMWS